MPGMKTVGTNTVASTNAMPTSGPEISSIAFKEALFGSSPSSIWRSTASTTTIASSTTSPIASTSPKSESVLVENPNNGNSTNVPTNETGTAHSGISVARQLCRKMNTTMTTSTSASNNVLTMSFNPSVTERV